MFASSGVSNRCLCPDVTYAVGKALKAKHQSIRCQWCFLRTLLHGVRLRFASGHWHWHFSSTFAESCVGPWWWQESWCLKTSSKFNGALVNTLNMEYHIRSRDSSLGEHRTRDRSVASSNPRRSGGRIFFSRVNFVFCQLLNGVRSTPVLPQWHLEDPGHFTKVQVAGYIGTRIHPWPNEVEMGWLCRCPGIVWEPIRKRAHNATCQGTFRHNRLSSLSYCGLIMA